MKPGFGSFSNECETMSDMSAVGPDVTSFEVPVKQYTISPMYLSEHRAREGEGEGEGEMWIKLMRDYD